MARARTAARAPRPVVWGGAFCIEELCQKREELCRQIQQEEDEKQRLQSEVRQLTEKLARVNENLARKIASRNEFDRTIAETEAAYLKILESSQTLLSVLKREAGNLTKGTASEQKSSGAASFHCLGCQAAVAQLHQPQVTSPGRSPPGGGPGSVLTGYGENRPWPGSVPLPAP
uniref:SS nuclear autoantigen 1 n=1 Tax=Suricata suricatta TaxID=37032 RepID=A0A673VAG7_SURSU